MDLFKASVTNQCISRTNVEIDVGQRLDVLGVVDLRDQFQEQTQFANLHCLVHDVHAIQVVDDDALEDEVASIRMIGYALQFSRKVGILGAAQLLHLVQTDFVQRLQNIHRRE